MNDTVTPIPVEGMLANWCRTVWGCAPDHELPIPAEQVLALHQLTEGVRGLLAWADAPEPTDEQAEESQREFAACTQHLRTWLRAFEEALGRQAQPKPKLWRPS